MALMPLNCNSRSHFSETQKTEVTMYHHGEPDWKARRTFCREVKQYNCWEPPGRPVPTCHGFMASAMLWLNEADGGHRPLCISGAPRPFSPAHESFPVMASDIFFRDRLESALIGLKYL